MENAYKIVIHEMNIYTFCQSIYNFLKNQQMYI
jgi:hypothetical protein